MTERFHGAVVWAGLHPDHQAEIGAVALELISAWWMQEQSADRSTDPLFRAAEAADYLLINELRQAVVDAVPMADFNAADGNPKMPSRLGQFCRKCGCTQEDGCANGCWWVEDDLCSSCAKEAAR
ncbi:hypothetical protein [Mesorhizobium sp.]|uniref:hypothetical protein n=1 Tax=Mesorhizobium sp. TaxID=1871066 RepID=UPI0011F4FEDE|nr:hypothetical protein [Mesorhizobium sp.]TIL36192.1 MAG: hypothetical protein E5Y85_00770 [Mesorhizobium sp.]